MFRITVLEIKVLPKPLKESRPMSAGAMSAGFMVLPWTVVSYLGGNPYSTFHQINESLHKGITRRIGNSQTIGRHTGDSAIIYTHSGWVLENQSFTPRGYRWDPPRSSEMMLFHLALLSVSAAVSRAEADMHCHGGVSYHTTSTNATLLACTAITTFV